MKLTNEARAISARAGAQESQTTSGPLHTERQRLLRFLIVGAVGYVVDAGLVALQVRIFGIGPFVSRGPSFLAAATVTWLLNRKHTFKGLERHSAGRSYRRYVLAQVVGGLINLSVYAAAIDRIAFCAKYPEIAVALAALFGMVVNYTLARLFVFPGHGR
jgi:putative flippase GtrA